MIRRRDRNWLEFQAVINAVFAESPTAADGASPDDAAPKTSEQLIASTQEFLARIAQQDGKRDRSGPLALLELEKRARAHSLSTGAFYFFHINYPA